jgi:hypothetical protein
MLQLRFFRQTVKQRVFFSIFFPHKIILSGNHPGRSVKHRIVMIVFDLACKCGYEFEGWFSHWRDFADQQAEDRISCPACGSNAIRKILSPVAVQNLSPTESKPSATPRDPQSISLSAALGILQEVVQRNFDNVGTDFAKEALKMHYGVAEERNIRGVATAAEEKTLRDEGIPLLKIPLPTRARKTTQ